MCKGIIGAIFGHKYQPVITKSEVILPPTLSDFKGKVEFFDMFRRETFNGYICVRCGDTKSKE